jgi:type IX secretion system PorP/SprF family membrane protein
MKTIFHKTKKELRFNIMVISGAKLRIYYISRLFLLSLWYVFYAQDIHFSQYQFSPLTINPGLAGCESSIQGIAMYRSQWQSAGFPYKTILASFDMRLGRTLEKGFWGVGVQIFSDQAGEVKISSNHVGISAGYHVRLNMNSTIGAALMGGIQQNNFNSTGAKWGNQYDENAGQWNGNINSKENISNTNRTFFDPGIGIVYRYFKNEKYMTGNDQLQIISGLSLFHLYKPTYGYLQSQNDKLYSRLQYFVRGLIGVPNTKISFVPALYVNVHGPALEITGGTYVKYMVQEPSKYEGLKDAMAVSPGIFYRGKDAASIQLLFEWSQFSVGFAYDVNVSKYKTVTNGRGGFEVMLRYVSPSPFGGEKSQARFFN